MKIETVRYNPLKLILDYLGTVEGPITQDMLDHVKWYLAMGGVCCETNHEILACLAIMHNLGMIELTDTKYYYEVKVIYGK